ncbi:MAG: PIN domain-containing protein [Actinomycetota bacterium]|nr:PIN domain-containing protein [Actinomycetota bacterium]
MTPDTSVVVAAFGRWHARHEAARDAVRTSERLIGHVAVESFSVLTRLPAPRRAPSRLVREFLDHHWPGSWLSMDGTGYRQLLTAAAGGQAIGGAIYDALIAVSARESGHTIVSLDERAVRTYQAFAAPYQLL